MGRVSQPRGSEPTPPPTVLQEALQEILQDVWAAESDRS
jgi:uncharacterized protein with von Willebrand factor type A (vWA) domain